MSEILEALSRMWPIWSVRDFMKRFQCSYLEYFHLQNPLYNVMTMLYNNYRRDDYGEHIITTGTDFGRG